jgi:hypothetical protein
LIDEKGVLNNMCFLAKGYLAHIHNLSTDFQINWKIPGQISKWGASEISHFLLKYWIEPFWNLDPVSKFQATTERPGYFVVFSDNVGELLNFKGTKNDLTILLK